MESIPEVPEREKEEVPEKPKRLQLTDAEKKLALFKARTVLSVYGTMEERRVCQASIKRMTRELNAR